MTARIIKLWIYGALLLPAWGGTALYAEIPPVYITVAGHIEDGDYYTECAVYSNYWEKLLVFADIPGSRGISWNLQIDYEFFSGTCSCETEAMRQQTGGTNIIQYLADFYDVEVDAHQEGGYEGDRPDNYADVRCIAGTLCTSVSENVGGFLWDNPPQFARLANGETGSIHAHFTWLPDILTLAVSSNHHNKSDFSMDEIASGVWKPAGANTNFWKHDPGERMIYIGPGEHSNWDSNTQCSTVEYVAHLVEGLENGTLPETNMYTVTVTIPQRVIFNASEHVKLENILDDLDPFITNGKACYVTYSQAAAIWQAEFGRQPNIYIRGTHPPEYRAFSYTNGVMIFSWMGLYGVHYSLETADDFNGSWTDVPGQGNLMGKNAYLVRTNQPDGQCRFFRIRKTD